METVAEAPNGLDPAPAFSELLAQPHDMHVYCAMLDRSIVSQGTIDEFIPRKNASRPRSEEVKEAKLCGGKFHSVTCARNLVPCYVDLEGSMANDVSRLLVSADPPQHGLHPRRKLPRAERLRNIVVRAQFQADDAVSLRVLGGQHDEGDPGRPLVGAQPLAHFEPVDARQHEIDQNQVRSAVDSLSKTRLAVRRREDLETLAPQVVTDQFDQVFFIVDDENGSLAHVLTAKRQDTGLRSASSAGEPVSSWLWRTSRPSTRYITSSAMLVA